MNLRWRPQPGPGRSHGATLLVMALVLSGCASHAWKGSVPAESRPVPEQPAEGDTVSLAPNPPRQPETPEQMRARVVADTTWCGEKVRRCLGQSLLPEQEGIIEATLTHLRDTRRALEAGDLVRAGSKARAARQLAASLRCT